MTRVLAIVGATATGKTALAERLANDGGVEVVCADSRQVYRELDIGTGKPSRAALAATPHHLFEALSLGETASAGWYARAARGACEPIRARGRVPLLTGGSGLYLRAAQEGLASTPPHDPAARERLRFELAAEGAAALHERLRRSDPESAARLAVSDVQRVLRALEVLEASGKPLSWWHRQPARAGVEGEWRIVELTVEPAELSKRIAERTRWMFEHGLIEEADAIASGGGEAALRKLRAVGYDEALDVREGRLTLAAAEARTIVRTRQLAKRQRTWFRHQIEAERVDATRLDPDSLVAIVRAALGL